MPGLPEITMAGTLVADPELRFLDSGVAVASFTVAANERRYDAAAGEWADKGATFLRCSAWRQLAENVSESLSKGARVLVTGVLRQRNWTTTEGEKRTGFDVDVTEVAASLKWATVAVRKADRATGAGPSDDSEPPF
jgi:single-strand DNA-binding protein